ncbi:hypothetical protein Ahy_B07g086889 [Arachis hypogaea]|uniref:Aspartic peptidase DDI1-type domain-containing protein n=1 Tax=Arachis hypogaea TaxID=3818 RepID=A0A444YAR3_ARAHY|nr:hypothetical protein Ahy_B07g086889 [Arachis hypogaea]
MGLGFYMHRKLLNVHIPNLAHLAKKIRQTELMKKEKEKYKSEQISKSKPFTRKEKVAYVNMESSEEELDFKTKIDLAELKKGPPYKIKNRDVSLCPRCNTVFDAEAAAIFEKERMKKELAHREKQARQRHPIRCVEGQSSKTPQQNMVAPLSRSQAIGVQWSQNCQEFQNRDALYRRNPQWGHQKSPRNQIPYYHGRARGYPRGRCRRNVNQNKKPQAYVSNGAMPSVHSRIVFPSDGKTYPKGIPSPTKMEKGKAIAQSSGVDKGKEVNLDEEYFEEGEDDMVGTISIIPTEYLGEYEGDPKEDYDVEAEEAFSFIRYEDEPGYFLRPTERQKSHIRPLHITTTLSGIKVNKVMIDGGATISLLPKRMLMKVEKHPDDLDPTNIVVTDFSCYLSSEGLTVKLRYPQLNVSPIGWNCLS